MGFPMVDASSSEHETFQLREGLHELDDRLVKHSKHLNNNLHKGADKTTHKVTNCTKKIFNHEK